MILDSQSQKELVNAHPMHIIKLCMFLHNPQRHPSVSSQTQPLSPQGKPPSHDQRYSNKPPPPLPQKEHRRSDTHPIPGSYPIKSPPPSIHPPGNYDHKTSHPTPSGSYSQPRPAPLRHSPDVAPTTGDGTLLSLFRAVDKSGKAPAFPPLHALWSCLTLCARHWQNHREGTWRRTRQWRLVFLRPAHRPPDDPHVRLRPQRHHRLQRVLQPLGVPRVVALALRPLRYRLQRKHQPRRVHQCPLRLRVPPEPRIHSLPLRHLRQVAVRNPILRYLRPELHLPKAHDRGFQALRRRPRRLHPAVL